MLKRKNMLILLALVLSLAGCNTKGTGVTETKSVSKEIIETKQEEPKPKEKTQLEKVNITVTPSKEKVTEEKSVTNVKKVKKEPKTTVKEQNTVIKETPKPVVEEKKTVIKKEVKPKSIEEKTTPKPVEEKRVVKETPKALNSTKPKETTKPIVKETSKPVVKQETKPTVKTLQPNAIYLNGQYVKYAQSKINYFVEDVYTDEVTERNKIVTDEISSKNVMLGKSFDPRDGQSNYFIGHNPGTMSNISNLKIGSIVTVTNSQGEGFKYKIIDQASQDDRMADGRLAVYPFFQGSNTESIYIQYCIWNVPYIFYGVPVK